MSANRVKMRQLIKASAGTGKTHRLTGHYIDLLDAGALPDTILATTFTRKAAGEIFGRVLTRLAEEAETSEAKRAHLLALCTQLHRVSISTLDSFFQKVGAGFRFELDLPVDPAVVDEKSPTATELRREAIGRMLREGAARDDDFRTLLDLLERLHHDRQKRSVADAIDEIVQRHADVYREQPDKAAWTALKVPREPTDEEVAVAVGRLDGMEDELPRKKSDGKPHVNFRKAWESDRLKIRAEDWDGLFGAGLCKAFIENRPKFGQAPLTENWTAAYTPIVAKIKFVFLNRIARQTEATWELMKRFDALYDALRRERGVLLYSDVPGRLSELVAPRGTQEQRWDAEDLMAAIQFRMDATVQHLLLDEFQDTSTQQWRVLGRFAQEIVDQPDRSLFVVGDAKQAIYGWRGGRVELFAEAADLVKRGLPEGEGDPETLALSYRTAQPVLDVVNTVFNNIAKTPTWACDDPSDPDQIAAARFQKQFETHQTAKPELPGFVCFGSSDAPDEDGGERADAEAAHLAYVADRVEEIHAQAPGATVGVLMNSNKKLNLMLLELRRRGLPASGEGGNPIAHHPAVAYLLAALCVADHPGDLASVLQLRRGPLSGFFGLDGAGTLRELDKKTVANAARVIRAELVTRGFADTLARWADRLRPGVDAAAGAKLDRLVALAGDYEAQSPAHSALRPRGFVDYVEQTHVQEPTTSPIRVMTVHKSKGLGFDAVVLPDLDAEMKISNPVLVDQPDATGPIHAVYRSPREEVRAMCPQLGEVYDRSKVRLREERICVLYVAMTRAKRALYLLVKPVKETKNRKKGRGAPTHAKALRDLLDDPDQGGAVVFGDEDWQAGLPAGRVPSAASRTVAPLGYGRDAKSMRLRPVVSPSALDARDALVSGAALLSRAPTRGQAYGTRVHEELCAVTYVDAYEASPGTGSDALIRALAFPAVRQALSPRFEREDVPWRERRFNVIDGSRQLRGTYDRVVVGRDAEGAVEAAHLIDFKTDTVDAGDADALAEKVERYRAQMEGYRAALVMQLGLSPDKVTAELLFVGAGVSVAV